VTPLVGSLCKFWFQYHPINEIGVVVLPFNKKSFNILFQFLNHGKAHMTESIIWESKISYLNSLF